jgi:hypothetical protein
MSGVKRLGINDLAVKLSYEDLAFEAIASFGRRGASEPALTSP